MSADAFSTPEDILAFDLSVHCNAQSQRFELCGDPAHWPAFPHLTPDAQAGVQDMFRDWSANAELFKAGLMVPASLSAAPPAPQLPLRDRLAAFSAERLAPMFRALAALGDEEAFVAAPDAEMSSFLRRVRQRWRDDPIAFDTGVPLKEEMLRDAPEPWEGP